MPEQLFLTPTEVGERYGVPVATLAKWRHRGYGPRSIRVGKHTRYPVVECERWEADQVERSAPTSRSSPLELPGGVRG